MYEQRGETENTRNCSITCILYVVIAQLMEAVRNLTVLHEIQLVPMVTCLLTPRIRR